MQNKIQMSIALALRKAIFGCQNIGRLINQPTAVEPACFITLQVTSGSIISSSEIRQNRTSAFHLRVVWTSAFKGLVYKCTATHYY